MYNAVHVKCYVLKCTLYAKYWHGWYYPGKNSAEIIQCKIFKIYCIGKRTECQYEVF